MTRVTWIWQADLVEADLTEWTHCGDILELLNLTPPEAELRIPSCFREDREEEINYKKTLIAEVLDKLGFTDKVSKVPQ